MAGVDTVRGIGFQQAQAVLEAIAVLDDVDAAAMRVEGMADVVDVEILSATGTAIRAKQIKIRSDDYTGGKPRLSACCAGGRLWPPRTPGTGSTAAATAS